MLYQDLFTAIILNMSKLYAKDFSELMDEEDEEQDYEELDKKMV